MSEPSVLVWLLIEQDGGVLLARRKTDRPPFAGRWTLPGDVMDEDESTSETIARVAREQLDVRVTDETFVDTLDLRADGDEFAVTVFRVAYAGRPRFRESGPYAQVRWFLPDVLGGDEYALPAGLVDLLLKTATRK